MSTYDPYRSAVPGQQPIPSGAKPARPLPAQPLPAQPVVPSAVPAHPNYAQPAYAQPARPVPVTPGMARPVPVTPGMAPAMPVARAATAARPVPVPAGAKPAAKPVGTSADTESSEGEDRKPPTFGTAAPPWLVSLILHIVMLIIMALIVRAMHTGTPPMVIIVPPPVYAEEIGEQLNDDSVKMHTDTPVDAKEAVWTPDNLPPVNDPLAAPPEVALSVDGTYAASEQKAAVIGLALSGRETGMKKVLLGAYGGNATTEAAVGKALEWLKRQQMKDGGWSLEGPYKDGGLSENRAGATAMALLAFQGAGHTHKRGAHKDVVARGWKYLLAHQNKDGYFVHGDKIRVNSELYAQAQATIAICELFGMEHDEAHRKPAQLAVDFAIKAQDKNLGGWRYIPGDGSDTSVTGWYVMALQSARMAGLEVSSPDLDLVNKFLDKVASNEGREYAYQIGKGATLPMTAEALLCRQYLGWKQDDPRLVDGMRLINANKVSFGDANCYYWYYATQVAHHMEGDAWHEWNKVMKQAVPTAQIQTGDERGSWDPTNDRWGGHGGRLFTTCLCTYMLEVYYRHLPIYSNFTRVNRGADR